MIVGVNQFVDAGEGKVEIHKVDATSETSQRARTAAVRAGRNPEAAAAALAEVERVAQTEANLLPAMREALRARCTIGEICTSLRTLWGTFDAMHA